uniref:Retrotransposon Copia-like N-terminal domain-containing protein n=1 Tax=Cannabis sativa TaxID=3483 RepID=A0A803NT53_CANSA
MDPQILENLPRSATQNQGQGSGYVPQPQHWNPFQNSLNSSLTVKLDRSNYLAWKSQVVPTVIGHGLDDLLFIELASEQVKSQLSMIQKGNLSIADYFDKVKVLGDTLSTASHPIDESDLIMHLLNGLGPEYDPVVVHVTSLVDDLSFESIQSLLLTHESRLERHYTVGDPSSKPSANLSVNTSRFSTGSRTSNYNGRGGASSQFNRNNPRSNGRGYPSNRLVCQAFLTEDDDPQAFYTSTLPDFGHDHEWYADTGANNHVATGMEHLEYESPYTGPDSLAVGNGKQLLISHLGQENGEGLT